MIYCLPNVCNLTDLSLLVHSIGFYLAKFWKKSAKTLPNSTSMHWWSLVDSRYVSLLCSSKSISSRNKHQNQTASSSLLAAGLRWRPWVGPGKREIRGDVHSHCGHPCHRLQQRPRLWLQHRRRHCPQHYHLSESLHKELHTCTRDCACHDNTTHTCCGSHRPATGSNSRLLGPSAVSSLLRRWADTAATWPRWPAWLQVQTLPTFSRKDSALETWRWVSKERSASVSSFLLTVICCGLQTNVEHLLEKMKTTVKRGLILRWSVHLSTTFLSAGIF